MRGITLLVTILVLSAALPLFSQTPQPESLGDLARQLREQHDKDAKKATKVFTNDNLPAPKFGEAISSSPLPPATPAAATETASKGPTPTPSQETNPESPEDKAKTRDYWQAKFKAARQDLAQAKEKQQLSEDELNLLQIQQVREMEINAKAELTAKVDSKQSEVDANKAIMQAAQKALDDLDKEFKDSGAPDDWSQTEHPQ